MFLAWLLELFVRFLAWALGVAILIAVGFGVILVQLLRLIVGVVILIYEDRAARKSEVTWVYDDADPDLPSSASPTQVE